MTAPARHEPLTSLLRLAVALSALTIYVVDPSEHPARRPFGLAVLLLFIAYSVATYAFAMRPPRRAPARLAPWIDIGWVTLLVAVSQGTSVVFYPLYLFAILYASFGRGFAAGISVAVASAASFAVVGVVTAPRDAGLSLTPFLVRPLYLLVLGYLTAIWGGFEVRSRARLALLREVTALSTPRFGVDRALARFLEAVRRFYDADACRVVIAEERSGNRWIQTAARGGAPAEHVAIPPEVAAVLLPEPRDAALLVHERGRWPGRRRRVIERIDPATGAREDGEPDVGAALLDALEAAALISVPFRYHATAHGRLHVVRRAPRPFDGGEVEFLRHALEQVGPVLENVRLVDRLASEAADEERRRIARDLHDSVIQPYLGLRLGLSAAEKALTAGDVREASAHVTRLVALADGEIETLRGYVRELRTGESAARAGLLDAGLRRFCSRFAEATGIQVDVSTEGAPVRSDRLAAEVFQMVAEALSNVRRHTAATRAEVRIQSGEDRLRVTILNDAASERDGAFHPRSIGERASALGGSVRVEHPGPGVTAVRVEVPL